MAALVETSDQSRSPAPSGPVFVDATGRRLRRFKLMGLATLGLVAGYVVLLLVAFLGGSGVSAPYLPWPAAAPAGNVPSPAAAPASNAAAPQAGDALPAGGALAAGDALAAGGALPAGAAAPAAAIAPGSGVREPENVVRVPVPSAVPVAPPLNSAVIQPPAAAAPVATPTPSPAAPGQSGTAPGQTIRPSAPPRP